ncbi:MAG TPA: asparagine synthase (glutamine-hydrolyzing) [Thermodesulfobacteriota bacterium]|nr:asparagine synthase (glutamine-hydrolyzing) [Thermodesulfobacteriota bacterium]
MCGLAGVLDHTARTGPEALREAAARMAEALRHRGPDDAGVWVDAPAGIGLGFRRLAIVDLTPAGRQPMESACGRYVLAFNGEIYNFGALRRELERLPAPPRFRGRSDTEVLLAAISRWGLEETLERVNGMFAIALWDRQRRCLCLVRDRLGEKPLYYGLAGPGLFLFGSELKALRAHPAFRGEIDRDALALFFRYAYIPAPYSIYRGIRKLPPGSLVTVPAGRATPLAEPVPYWSARAAAERGVAEPFGGTTAEAVEALDALVRDAVALRLEADVPLGAFLSGGIDSSTVVALMQAQSARPVRTFTIGFHEPGYDEAAAARAVARHLGTEHTELYVTPAEAMAVIPRLPELYDEPFADASQIPTFLVAQLARRHVTVTLSGDGGDELFGGYTRYAWAASLRRTLRRVPAGLGRLAARGIGALSPEAWDAVFRSLGPLLPRRARQSQPGDKLHKLAAILADGRPAAIYRGLVSHWPEPGALVRGASEPETVLTCADGAPAAPDFLRQMMYLDLVTYLPDDILVKLDRATMGVGLEARVPLLDHRVVEFAWRLPVEMKLRDGRGKWLLRRLLARYVPPELVERPKMGFGVPIGRWLRGPLREWAESLLDEGRLAREGFLDPGRVRARWTEHLAGSRNWQYLLWDVLMFQAWLDAYRS